MTSPGDRQRISMTRLSGMPVLGPDNEVLGQVENLSFDARDGAVDSVRLRLAGSPSGRVLRIDLPWSLLRLHASGRHLTLDIALPTLVSVATQRIASADD